MNEKEMVQIVEVLEDRALHLARRMKELEKDYGAEGSQGERRYTLTKGGPFITSAPKPYPSTGYCPICQKAVIIEINVQKGEITCTGKISVSIKEVCFECKHTLRTRTSHIDL